MNTFTESVELLARAKACTPAGAQTYSKSSCYYLEGSGPAFAASGRGGRLIDVDGNEFVDLVLGLGAIAVGYSDARVNARVVEQLECGVAFTLPTRLEVELMERLVEVIPCAERVRLLKNGTDATTAAVRLARAFTGRDDVALCGYHGWQDWSIGTTLQNLGVPAATKALSHRFTYNDLASLESVLKAHPVACVVLEPVNQVVPSEGFLASLVELAHGHGALVVFDEVVTGFRLHVGGGQAFYGVTPDLACLGKGMANGFPLSAVVGRADILELIEHGAFVSTTHGGETMSIAAALATIDILSAPDAIGVGWRFGKKLMDARRAYIESLGLRDVVTQTGLACHPGLRFSDFDALSANAILSVYLQAMFDGGVLCLGVNNFCVAHNDDDLAVVLNATEDALRAVRQAIDDGNVDAFVRGELYRPVFSR